LVVGGVHDTVIDVDPFVTVGTPGVPGMGIGWIDCDRDDVAEVPAALVAVAIN
jgi:hypothetical protein